MDWWCLRIFERYGAAGPFTWASVGTVLAGSVELTIGDKTQTYKHGDSYDIPAGVEHSGVIKAGAKAIDVFAEADRYPIKR